MNESVWDHEEQPQALSPPGPWDRVAYWEVVVDDPTANGKLSGFPTAHASLYPGHIDVHPVDLARRMIGLEDLVYDWPVVVVERRRPLGLPFLPAAPSILLDCKGELGRMHLRGDASPRLTVLLEQAGFEVIEVTRRGSWPPEPVSRAVLGDRVQKVPRSVVGR